METPIETLLEQEKPQEYVQHSQAQSQSQPSGMQHYYNAVMGNLPSLLLYFFIIMLLMFVSVHESATKFTFLFENNKLNTFGILLFAIIGSLLCYFVKIAF